MSSRKRGGDWERVLDVQHDLYRRARSAVVFRCHPGTKVLDGGARTIFSSTGPPDYVGLSDNRLLCFDAKECSGGAWSFTKLKRHQATDLEAVVLHGGIAFLALRFRSTNTNGIVLWDDISERYWTQTLKQLKADDPWFRQTEGANWLPVVRTSSAWLGM